MSHADCLRLLGENAEAHPIYERVLELAHARGFTGLKSAILWRLTEMTKANDDWKKARMWASQLKAIVCDPGCTLRFAKLYFLLTNVPFAIQDRKWLDAAKLIACAEKETHLSHDYMRAEYAHTRLFLGEMARRQNR